MLLNLVCNKIVSQSLYDSFVMFRYNNPTDKNLYLECSEHRLLLYLQNTTKDSLYMMTIKNDMFDSFQSKIPNMRIVISFNKFIKLIDSIMFLNQLTIKMKNGQFIEFIGKTENLIIKKQKLDIINCDMNILEEFDIALSVTCTGNFTKLMEYIPKKGYIKFEIKEHNIYFTTRDDNDIITSINLNANVNSQNFDQIKFNSNYYFSGDGYYIGYFENISLLYKKYEMKIHFSKNGMIIFQFNINDIAKITFIQKRDETIPISKEFSSEFLIENDEVENSEITNEISEVHI